MELVYVLLDIGCGLSLVRADQFQVARRDAKSIDRLYCEPSTNY